MLKQITERQLIRRETHLTWRVFLPVATIMKSQYCLSSGTRITTMSRSWSKSQIVRKNQEDFVPPFLPWECPPAPSGQRPLSRPSPAKRNQWCWLGLACRWSSLNPKPSQLFLVLYFASVITNADETIRCPHLFTLSWLEYFSPGVGFLPLSISSSLPSCKNNNLHDLFVAQAEIFILDLYQNATSIALLIASLSSSTSRITRESESR